MFNTLNRSLHLAPPFLIESYVPRAVKSYQSGLLEQKVAEANEKYKDCRLCPRNCGVNRLQDKKGACNTGRRPVVSSAFPHFGEESVLQGWNGSGTIFFSLCNLRCVFCQNWDISQRKKGWELEPLEITDLMLKLQNETHCHNINFVTPEHVVPSVIEAIYEAVKQGLNIPIVYNTSSYDSMDSLRLLEGIVDIYMPDFKFWTQETSYRLSKARDYPETAMKAIKEMHRQVGDLVFDSSGLAKQGLLVRHLVMPNYVDEAAKIMHFLSEEISKDTYVHIMEQYRPDFLVGKGEKKIKNWKY
ncbi:uncharacterized protein [Lepeophtheirus salmonis]|uniref:uncharacterized protein n=1 Tax=Lepeophtheirus salmonis TaxID=72036 RepID=UPI001AE8A40F|nr:uncharacterized protein LOC121117527 [Lepeophtheirus salmonis]